MLPPPTTTATSTPRSCWRRTCSAIAAMRTGSAPYARSPISASPESFSSIRLKAGPASASATRSGLLADLVAREAADHDVLAGLRRRGRAQVLDGLAAVLVLVHVLLVEQHDLLEPLAQPPLGDLRAHVLGLVGGLLLEDAQLAPAILVGDLVLGHVLGGGSRDVQGDVAGELLEVVVARHEVRLAVDLDEHADLAGRVHVALDHALGRRSGAALRRLRLALHAEDVDGLLDVAAGLDERLLAVHHPRAGLIAQRLHVLRRYVCHQLLAPSGLSGLGTGGVSSPAFCSASSPPRGRAGGSSAGAFLSRSACSTGSRVGCSP